MPLRIGTGGADDTALQAGHHRREAASGDTDPLDDVGDRAHVRVIRPVARDQHHLLLVPHVGGERHGHARKHYGIFEGDEPQGRHGA